jgi:hypothetical protein
MTTGTVAAEVTEHTTEDELERRILSALGKVE